MHAITDTSGSPWPSSSKSRYHGVMQVGPVLVPSVLEPVSLDSSVVELVLVVLASEVELLVVGVSVLVSAGPVVVTGALELPELPVSVSWPFWKHATNSKIGAR